MKKSGGRGIDSIAFRSEDMEVTACSSQSGSNWPLFLGSVAPR